MSVSSVVVADRVRRHHAQLSSDLREAVHRLVSAAEGATEAPLGAIVQVMEDEIFPHARFAEKTLFRAADAFPDLAPRIPPLKDQHRDLGRRLAQLRAADDDEAPTLAMAMADFFDDHISQVNALLDPMVAHGVDLEAVLADDPGDEAHPDDVSLDLRQLPHAQRHELIFASIPRLRPGQALVITNDHDPLPLRYQMEAMHPDTFDWSYLEEGPEAWRVAIRRK